MASITPKRVKRINACQSWTDNPRSETTNDIPINDEIVSSVRSYRSATQPKGYCNAAVTMVRLVMTRPIWVAVAFITSVSKTGKKINEGTIESITASLITNIPTIRLSDRMLVNALRRLS